MKRRVLLRTRCTHVPAGMRYTAKRRITSQDGARFPTTLTVIFWHSPGPGEVMSILSDRRQSSAPEQKVRDEEKERKKKGEG